MKVLLSLQILNLHQSGCLLGSIERLKPEVITED
jgi:hypothetical protein